MVLRRQLMTPSTRARLFKSDGVTPLTDTNGDGVVDTGPIAASGTYNVIAKVTLPSTYSETDANITNLTTLTLTPVSNPSKTDTIKLIITDVVNATVDLTNGDNTDTTTGGPTAGSSGQDTGVPVDTKTTAPGTAVTFPLSVTNNSATPDNFNLSSTGLPSGWTVQYYVDADGNGVPDGGAAITNTGNIPAGSTVNLIAVVTPSANQAPITQNVVFTVSSPATGLTDSMTDQVVVSTKRSLSLTADNVGQVAPGGTVTYTHTLTNNGTITEGTTAGSLPYTLTNNQPGWTTTLYVDLNNDGLADNNELVTGNDLGALIATYNPDNDSTSGLEAGQSIKLLIKVEAPANATAGVQNSNVLTVSPTTVSGTATAPVSNTDLTTVNDGQIRLVKEQALDADCDGTADTSFTQNNLSAKPGTCVVYRITATNEGNVPVTTVKINDTVPTYTTLVSGSQSNNNTSGTVTVNGVAITNSVASLSGNTSAQLQFTVKIDE